MPKSTKAAQPYAPMRNVGTVLSLYTSTKKTPAEGADIQLVPLSCIYVDTDRVRKYFDSTALQSLAKSIQQHGFVGAIVVRPYAEADSQYQYALVAGGRRYAASKLANLDTIRIIVADLSEEQALEFELIENLQREDLNPIEETQGLLHLLSMRLQLEQAEVIALFQRYAYLLRQAQSSQVNIDILLSEDSEFHRRWQTIEQLFEVVGRFTPDSFRANRLKLLNLPDPILQAVNSGQLEYSKAILVARIKDESARTNLLHEALSQKLSQAQILEQIRHINASITQDNPSGDEARQIQTRATGIAKSLKKANLSSRDRTKVEKLLNQLEEILNPD